MIEILNLIVVILVVPICSVLATLIWFTHRDMVKTMAALQETKAVLQDEINRHVKAHNDLRDRLLTLENKTSQMQLRGMNPVGNTNKPRNF